MKSFNPLILGIVFSLASLLASAQSTSFETDFSKLAGNNGNWAFIDDFESAEMDTLWDMANPVYSLTQTGGLLNVEISKNSGFQSFARRLPFFYDFSYNPYINLKVRGDNNFILWVYLVDINDQNSYRAIRVSASDAFVNCVFDFTGETEINLEYVKTILFAVNPMALTYNGTVWFDDLKAGSEAQQMAYMAGVPDQVFYKNSGTPSVLIHDIINIASISASGGSELIGNVQFSTIENGLSVMTFDILPDSTGSDIIILTAEGAEGLANNNISFMLKIEDNLPPEVYKPTDILAIKGEEKTVRISGISDGNESIEQIIAISVIHDNNTILSEPVNIKYEHGSPYAWLSFVPSDTGTVNITVGVMDNGGGADSTSVTFMVRVFGSINLKPTIDPVPDQSAFKDAGEQTIRLTGIGDGDNGSQTMEIRATSSADTIIPNPLIIEYTGGDAALLKYTPISSYTGITYITLTVADDGGTALNNGNDSVTIQFKIETRVPPLSGHVVPMEGDPYQIFGPEGRDVIYFLSYVDSGDFKAMKIDMVDKWEYGGIWMDLPQELDLTQYPYISYEVYSVDTSTYHWNYFYDVDNQRNIQNSSSHMYVTERNKWVTLSFDYSDPGDMNTEAGEVIQTDRIHAVLFNLHWRKGSWPFTNFTGTVYYRNIRIGDQAVITPKDPVCTANGIPELVHFLNEDEAHVTLSGISNGTGSTEGVTVTAKSNNTEVVPAILPGTLNPDGSVELTYTIGITEGIAPIEITVSATGSVSKIVKSYIHIVKEDPITVATINIDRNLTYQTILGFGTFQNERRWVDLYARDLGASAIRFGLISNQIEPVNDNNDPYILNREGLNYNAFDWDYIRELKEAGVETFILTSWSPPAWMKHNFSEDWFQANVGLLTETASNRLEFHYYDEFAESMVAVVRMFEEEAGVHLEAIGLQNEPAFYEPYASAILDPEYFSRLISVVGKRFEMEGISTRLYMPEQVFGQNANSMDLYIDSLVNNLEADKYCDIIAVHGYANDGINPGFPDYSGWKNLWNESQTGSSPKELWMSETFIEGGSFSAALDLAGAIHGSLWAGNISLWTNWAFDGVQITKNKPNNSFYTSKNYYKFIRPGAVRVSSGSNNADIMVTAFEHPVEKTFTIVAINKSSIAKTVRLFGNNLPGAYTAFRTTQYEYCLEVDSIYSDIFILPPRSVTTLTASSLPLLKINAIPDQYLEMNDPEQVIPITGIDNGYGSTASLGLAAETDNPVLVTQFNVSGVQPDGTAILTFTPGTNQKGTTKITLTLSDGVNTSYVVFYVIVIDHTGLAQSEQRVLKVYPNPADEMLNIEIPDPSFNEIVISDISGRIIMKKQPVSGQVVVIETGNLEAGTYIITVGNGKEFLRTKFIVE